MSEQAHIFEIKLYCENRYNEKSNIPCNSADIIPLLEARFNKYQWAWVLHDKDKFDDGTPKKAHVHFLVNATNTTISLDKVRRDFSISYANVYAKDNWEQSLKYLLHRTEKCYEDNKYVYPDDALHSNFDAGYYFITKALKEKKEAQLIVQFVVQYYKQNMSLLDLTKYADDIGEYKFFHKEFNKIVKIIEDERQRTYRLDNYSTGHNIFGS